MKKKYIYCRVRNEITSYELKEVIFTFESVAVVKHSNTLYRIIDINTGYMIIDIVTVKRDLKVNFNFQYFRIKEMYEAIKQTAIYEKLKQNLNTFKNNLKVKSDLDIIN